MANNLGTLSSGTVLSRALELVFTKRPLLNAISLDLSNEEAKQNDTVQSRIFSVPAVSNFPSAATDVVATDVPVVLDQAKQVRHKFTSAELTSTDRNLVDEAAEPVAIAIANHMVDAIAANWIAANFANATTKATASVDYTTTTALRKALTGRGAPDKRFGAVNADVYEKLLNDPLVNRQYKDSGSDPIADGIIRSVAGFDSIFEYPALPTTGNLTGFFGSQDSCVLAARVPKNPKDVLPNAVVPGAIGVIKEKRTGLSIMVAEWINISELSVEIMAVWLYGTAKGNASNGQRLISA